MSELIRITDVELRGGYVLHLRFEDGAEGDVDIAEHNKFIGDFQALKDPTFFAKVFVDPDWGTICWPRELDLAPEPLYEAATGRTPDYVEKPMRAADSEPG